MLTDNKQTVKRANKHRSQTIDGTLARNHKGQDNGLTFHKGPLDTIWTPPSPQIFSLTLAMETNIDLGASC